MRGLAEISWKDGYAMKHTHIIKTTMPDMVLLYRFLYVKVKKRSRFSQRLLTIWWRNVHLRDPGSIESTATRCLKLPSP